MGTILRDYQEQIKRETYEAWQAGAENVLLVMPTGMGKTRTFCSIAKDVAVLPPAHQRLPTVIMVHRKELVQQIALTLAEEGIFHNIIAPRPTIRAIVGAQRQLFGKQFYDYNAGITVCSVDTLNSRIDVHRDWVKKIKFWIVDEAAHVLRDNKWGRAVSYFQNARGLGVTATPERLDRRGLGRHADGVFDVMVEGPPTKWGIQNGYLSKYKVVIPESDYAKYLKKAADGSDYSKEAMTEASNKSRIVGDVIETYIKFALGKQAIYFVTDMGTGRRMEEGFNERGVRAKLLTAESSDADRFKSLMEYREKKIQVLINIDLFDEGLDVPGIEVVGMARPTMSLGKFLQMCGRGLRPAPGKPYLILIDHVGNIGIGENTKHGLPDSIRRWTLDRIIRRRRPLNLLRICDNPVCASPFERLLTACPYCGQEIGKPHSGGGGGRPGPAEVDGDLHLLDPETIRELVGASELEAPGDVGRRVSAAAGVAAGQKAMKAQMERIETQKLLRVAIAKWAGRWKSQGYTDRHINKQFYLQFGKTITEALGETRAEMEMTLGELE